MKFHDFPGLENEIVKFHDFPGFQDLYQPWFRPKQLNQKVIPAYAGAHFSPWVQIILR